MFQVCEKHNDCVVVHHFFGCPICEMIEDFKQGQQEVDALMKSYAKDLYDAQRADNAKM